MAEEPDQLAALSRRLRALVAGTFGDRYQVRVVADRAGISRNTLSAALNARLGADRKDRKVPALRTLERIADVTGADVGPLEELREAALRQVDGVAPVSPGSPVWSEFATPPAGLADDLLVADFAYGIVEPLARGFVGRNRYIDAVEAAIEDTALPSGYILITGEPGIGKTSLMAELVRRRKWLHHFNVAASGASTTEAFLRNVCAQLIVRYHLDHTSLPPRAGRDGLFLLGLLGTAAACQDTPLVIVVDAIDEAADDGRPGINRLALPRQLPDNVYVVVTSRGRNAYELDADRIRHMEIGDDDEANQADLLLYVETFIEDNAERLADVLASAGQKSHDFAKQFLERSEGNFLYAVRVLPEIAGGELLWRGDIDDLPLGLREYYRRHWVTMRAADPELFDEVHRPVILGFAILHQTTAEIIAQTLSLPLHPVRTAVATWQEFLNRGRPRADGHPVYRIYHKSFLDFLSTTAGIDAVEKRLLDFVDDAVEWDDE
ncbi:AAA family ATPase [Streptomyces sp. NBC_00513]|uniref:ATP-binding protein n=1 Tax=unclassified Streptomyces TaxID=2593676 RepID=UPI0022510632|nr:AAA family ATPase [Streptomyces sp. NBC_00424]MCX5077578.1 AAA family ATPase [Streptomyces sp. NBC_00424]WUD39448.1 AAA family ATPase [Streptomyces sp. NBC_00513]